LAAGRGTRMREPDPSVALTPEQAAMADQGLKALVPIHGHPFLAYVLGELAEAGYEDVCLVVGPGPDDPIRRAVEAMPIRRLRVVFAEQMEPLGSAHALLAAEAVTGDTPVVVINADNLYPARALEVVRTLDGPGLVGFDVEALVEQSNILPEQVAAFALIDVEDGYMARIVEKPDPATARQMAGAPVSMTCWRFHPSIYDACRDIEPSERGELELADAVALAMDRGTRFRVVPAQAGVLDISRRAHIPTLERWLEGVEPRP
ncbi:MAG: sugar phosphate nucleotidyltransferase, partial [Gemmatimonadota bacterium]